MLVNNDWYRENNQNSTKMENKVLHGVKLVNIENLKDIIENIAMCQARELAKETISTNVSADKREFNIVKIAQQVISMEPFNALDEAAVHQEVETLEESVRTIMNSHNLVKDQSIRKLVPLPYEFLSLVFAYTDEKFRQHYFQELTHYYFNKLCDNIKELESRTVLKKGEFDIDVKALLPVIKFEIIVQLWKNKDPESQRLLQEIKSNIDLFLKYPRFNKEDIFVVVSNNVGSKDFQLLSYKMIPLEERNGHMGDYFRLTVVLQFQNANRILNLFAKFLTPKLKLMKQLAKAGPSKKEEFFYMTYLPLLKKEGLESLVDFSPRCYFSRLDDVLVLDDMGTLEFIAVAPNIKLEFDSLRLAVKRIAKFHSCTMILEEILSEKEGIKVTLHDLYEEYLKEAVFIPDDDYLLKSDFDSSLDTILYLTTKFPESTNKFTTDELKEKLGSGWKSFFKKLNMSDKFKNTMCHGDMYVGNMMFKFDKEGICQDATLVDFQILRYCPPTHDLLFCIYQNSFKETRDKYYNQLVDEYYLELSKHFENFGLNIAEIYPRRDFEESLDYMKSQVLFQALFYSLANMLEPSLREKIYANEEMAKKYFYDDKTALVDLGLESDDYRRAMRGLVADFVELCDSGAI